MEMYGNEIALTAYRSDEEAWRLIRLERVIGYVCALAEQNNDEEVLECVSRLHDHKGTLSVKWKKPTNKEQKDYFLKAWESIIGDGADNVEHIPKGVRFQPDP